MLDVDHAPRSVSLAEPAALLPRIGEHRAQAMTASTFTAFVSALDTHIRFLGGDCGQVREKRAEEHEW